MPLREARHHERAALGLWLCLSPSHSRESSATCLQPLPEKMSGALVPHERSQSVQATLTGAAGNC